MKRREFIAGIGAVGTASTFVPFGGAMAGSGVEILSYRSGESGFFRAPVLVTGPTEALLIDGGFNYPDGRALAEAIAATGKTLTTIYISQSDPDYYFSLKPVVERFPNAKVIAASATRAAIDGNVKKKIEAWSPQLGENGPQSLDDIVFAEAFDGPFLTVDEQTIEIVTASELDNRRYLWVPSRQAIVGGVMVFSGTHVWVADTPSAESRAAWVRELESMLDRDPKVVIPGHAMIDASVGQDAIRYTLDYLLTFEKELAKAPDAAALIQVMQGLYPNAGMGVALQIGAKVAKGEMSWG